MYTAKSALSSSVLFGRRNETCFLSQMLRRISIDDGIDPRLLMKVTRTEFNRFYGRTVCKNQGIKRRLPFVYKTYKVDESTIFSPSTVSVY